MNIKLSRIDKIFIAYVSAFFVAMALVASQNQFLPDEGTHLLLSLFYKDLVTHTASSGDFSFAGVYGYAINYLVHYPKLQIAYPPLYHLTNALFFSILGPSLMLGRLVNLAYAVLAFTAFYFLVKKYFGERPAFISALLLSVSPFSLLQANMASLDYSFLFWCVTSLYLFSKAMETKRPLFFALCGLATGLAFLGRQFGAFLMVFYPAIILMEKGDNKTKAKNLFLTAAMFALIAVPYLAILTASGGLDVNATVARLYAGVRGQPTSYLDPMFWLYYLVFTPTSSPLSLALLAGLAYYSWKKQKFSKELLAFFLVMYVCISLVPTKELRFSEVFMLPAYATVGILLSKMKSRFWPALFVAAFFVVSAAFLLPQADAIFMKPYPVQEIADGMVPNMPAGSSIAMLSDDGPLFSSVLMWQVRLADKNMEHSVYRPCAFDNMSAEQIDTSFKEGGVYYAVYSDPSSAKNAHHFIDLIRNELEPAFNVTQGGVTTYVYKYKNFTPQAKKCNYVCLTAEKICS